MPLPFILGAIAIAAAGVGVKKGVDAIEANSEANDKNDEANRIISDVKYKAEKANKEATEAIAELGKKKANIINGSLHKFRINFEKLKNTEGLLREVSAEGFQIDKRDLEKFKDLEIMAGDILGGAAGGTALGAAAAFGAYSATGLLATASTGTAIAGLSGAAATNATLAALGGGSLAAGGFGMAGGMAVLGGIVAGPAIAILGTVLNASAQKNLDEAKKNLAKAKAHRAEVEPAIAQCNAIRDAGRQVTKFLVALDGMFIKAVDEMAAIIRGAGAIYNYDYSNFAGAEKAAVMRAAALAGAVNTVLKVALLTKNGEVDEESIKKLNKVAEKVNKKA